MPKRKRRSPRRYIRRLARRVRRPKTIPLLPTLAVGKYLADVLTAGGKTSELTSGNIGRYINWCFKDAILYGTGYNTTDGKWYADAFMQGSGLIILAGIAHKALNWLGVNRHFAKLPRPLNKLRL